MASLGRTTEVPAFWFGHAPLVKFGIQCNGFIISSPIISVSQYLSTTTFCLARFCKQWYSRPMCLVLTFIFSLVYILDCPHVKWLIVILVLQDLLDSTKLFLGLHEMYSVSVESNPNKLWFLLDQGSGQPLVDLQILGSSAQSMYLVSTRSPLFNILSSCLLFEVLHVS